MKLVRVGYEAYLLGKEGTPNCRLGATHIIFTCFGAFFTYFWLLFGLPYNFGKGAPLGGAPGVSPS